MTPKFLSNIDFALNQIINGRFQLLASAPGSPIEGQFYYDTTLHQFGVYQNTTWVYLGATTANAVTRASTAGQSGELMISAGADRSAQSFTTNGLLKIASGIVAQAIAGTDYSTPSATETLTNKTINGSNNTISNLILSMFAANVIDTDGTLSANSNTRLATQAAIVSYVQAFLQGVQWKNPVVASTTAALPANTYNNGTSGVGATLTGNSNGALSAQDGVTLTVGQSLLVMNEVTAANNGIYTLTQVGTGSTPYILTRRADYNTSADIIGAVVSVEQGTVNADTAWICTNNTVTVGTTALTFVNFVSANVPSASTTVQGKVQLAQTSDTAARSSTTLAVTPASLSGTPQKKTFTIGDGSSTSIACTHNLGTQDVVWSMRDASSNSFEITDAVATDANNVTFTFNTAPALNSLKVVIIG